MNNIEFLKKIRNLSIQDQRNIPCEEIREIYNNMNESERIELSNIIGYNVLIRMLMGEKLRHKFVLLQSGAAAIIVNQEGQILMQSRADRNKWGLPGGCQELGETFEDTIIREIYEETNLVVEKDDLELIAAVSGESRKNAYPNGDTVFNNTILYCIRNYIGELKWNSESKCMKFFDLDNLPENQHDPDLVEIYKKSLGKSK